MNNTNIKVKHLAFIHFKHYNDYLFVVGLAEPLHYISALRI